MALSRLSTQNDKWTKSHYKAKIYEYEKVEKPLGINKTFLASIFLRTKIKNQESRMKRIKIGESGKY